MSRSPSFRPPASHPTWCESCHGTGWEDGPVRYAVAAGDPVTYRTVQPCTDDTWLRSPPAGEPVPLSDPGAQAAFDAGYAQGLADLDRMRRPRRPPE